MCGTGIPPATHRLEARPTPLAENGSTTNGMTAALRSLQNEPFRRASFADGESRDGLEAVRRRARGLRLDVSNATVVLQELTVALPNLPDGLVGLRLGHVSDLHAGRWNPILAAAQDLLLAADLDLLLATGDFCTSSRRWRRGAEVVRRFFGPIAERTPVFGVLGNHDHRDLAGAPDLPLTLLRNESGRFRRDGAILRLAGVEQTEPYGGDVGAALSGVMDASATVLLAHYPSTVFKLPPGLVDLQLSGHTHGGQIRLPWLGCLWTNDRISRRMARGLHVVGGTVLYVSAGVGVSPPIPIRVNCPAEVAVLTLERAGAVSHLILRVARSAALSGRA